MSWQLVETPPAEHFLAIYFAAQKWWEPPSRTSAADGAADGEPEVWDSGLPDETE
jgi:hypothetical protein